MNVWKRLHRRTYIDQETGCWEWTGSKTHDGYGLIRFGIYGMVLVHRLSAHLHKGFDLRSDYKQLHKCDNPACWNPEHLFEGTDSDNLRDSHSKGRRSHVKSGPKKQTHCIYGHEFTPENTYLNRGTRACKTCVFARIRKYRKEAKIKKVKG